MKRFFSTKKNMLHVNIKTFLSRHFSCHFEKFLRFTFDTPRIYVLKSIIIYVNTRRKSFIIIYLKYFFYYRYYIYIHMTGEKIEKPLSRIIYSVTFCHNHWTRLYRISVHPKYFRSYQNIYHSQLINITYTYILGKNCKKQFNLLRFNLKVNIQICPQKNKQKVSEKFICQTNDISGYNLYILNYIYVYVIAV